MQTIDGALVWKAKATHGCPLDMAIEAVAKRNLVPTWDTLYAAAKQDGANLERLTRELQFYVKEAYAPEFAREVCERLALMPAYTEAHP